MDSLLMYGSDSDDPDGDPSLSASDRDTSRPPERPGNHSHSFGTISASTSLTMTLPPPPEDLLTSSTTPGSKDWNAGLHGGRIRSFPHVEGNYAVHIYIPVTLPSYARNEAEKLIDKALKRFPRLQVSEEGFTEHSLGEYGGTDSRSEITENLRAEHHISLSRTVPVRIHQIESITSMLRQKFSNQKRYFVEFNSWDVFTNDERTRTFLSVEITSSGLSEIRKQVQLVNETFKLHNLPAFYTNPRPHISLAWAGGEVASALKTVAEELNYSSKGGAMNSGDRNTILWSSQVRRVECKIGKRVYTIWGNTGQS